MIYNIAMVAAEVKPYCKKGGVADVVTDLSNALIDEGHSVKIITYNNKNLREGIGSHQVQSAGHVEVPLGGSSVRFDVGTVASRGAPTVYVLQNNKHASVDDAVYPVSDTDAERYGTKYAAFSAAAAHLIATHPDFKDTRIAHLHDYQAAVTAPILKSSLQWTGGILQTLHNIGYGPRCDAFQGVYDASVLAFIGLSSLFHVDALEYYGKANFLKGGCLFSDVVSCVSERYSQEILRENYGGGLEGVMRRVMPRGVVNGIATQDPHFRPAE